MYFYARSTAFDRLTISSGKMSSSLIGYMNNHIRIYSYLYNFLWQIGTNIHRVAGSCDLFSLLAFQWQRVIKLHFQEKTDGRESVSAIRSLPGRFIRYYYL
jgi:hypothetical protein